MGVYANVKTKVQWFFIHFPVETDDFYFFLNYHIDIYVCSSYVTIMHYNRNTCIHARWKTMEHSKQMDIQGEESVLWYSSLDIYVLFIILVWYALGKMFTDTTKGYDKKKTFPE